MTLSVDFFFYGTLRDPEVRAAVLGPQRSAPECEPAVLGDYRCVPVEAGAFPVLQPQAGAAAEGLLVHGVDLTAAARVSFFEGEGYEYRPQPVTVETDAGPERAWVYMPTGRLRIEPGEWDFETWRRRYKTAFLANARRAMRQLDGARVQQYREAWRRRLG